MILGTLKSGVEEQDKEQYSKRTPDVQDRPQRTTQGLSVRGVTLPKKVKEVGMADEYVMSVGDKISVQPQLLALHWEKDPPDAQSSFLASKLG